MRLSISLPVERVALGLLRRMSNPMSYVTTAMEAAVALSPAAPSVWCRRVGEFALKRTFKPMASLVTGSSLASVPLTLYPSTIAGNLARRVVQGPLVRPISRIPGGLAALRLTRLSRMMAARDLWRTAPATSGPELKNLDLAGLRTMMNDNPWDRLNLILLARHGFVNGEAARGFLGGIGIDPESEIGHTIRQGLAQSLEKWRKLGLVQPVRISKDGASAESAW